MAVEIIIQIGNREFWKEYANHVEADMTIEAGNSFRGILYEIGKLLSGRLGQVTGQGQ